MKSHNVKFTKIGYDPNNGQVVLHFDMLFQDSWRAYFDADYMTRPTPKVDRQCIVSLEKFELRLDAWCKDDLTLATLENLRASIEHAVAIGLTTEQGRTQRENEREAQEEGKFDELAKRLNLPRA